MTRPFRTTVDIRSSPEFAATNEELLTRLDRIREEAVRAGALDDPDGYLNFIIDCAFVFIEVFGLENMKLSDHERMPAWIEYANKSIGYGAIARDEAESSNMRFVAAIEAGRAFEGLFVAYFLGYDADTSLDRRQRLDELNQRAVMVKATITRDGRTREGYEKRPVTTEERGKVLKLNRLLAKEFPVKAQRYREIARQCDIAEGRVRYIIDPEGRRGKKNKSK